MADLIRPDLVEIDFYGDTILARRTGNGPRDAEIVVRRICDNLGCDFSTQLKVLKKAAWSSCGSIPMTAADGKTYQMTTIPLKAVPMWLAGISADRVAGHVREKLVRYQLEAADVLADHFMPHTAAPSVALDIDSNDGLLLLSSKLTERLIETTKRAEVAEGKVLQLAANLDAAEALVGEAADAVAFANIVRADNDAEYTITRAAGILQMKRSKFIHFLVNGDENNLVSPCYRDRSMNGAIMPRAQFKPRYFRERLHEYIDSKTDERKTSASARVTHEGIYWLAKKLGVTPDFDAQEAAE